ncbi:MAG: LemA family protein [Rhodospirillaceae bacterium]
MVKATAFEPANNDGAQLHRIRKSEEILAELYNVKPRPMKKPKIRAVRGVRTMLTLSLITIAAAVSVVYYEINKFIMLQEAARSSEANLATALQRRANLFNNLINLTLNHAALEHAVFSHTAEKRTEIIKESKLPDALADAIGKDSARATAPGGRADWEGILKGLSSEGGSQASVGRLLAMVEQYPNIKSSETFGHLMTSLVEMEDRIAERRMELNESDRLYNTAVTSFPWQYLASVSGFNWRGYSHAADGTGAAPDIAPKVYQELVPLVRSIGGPH